MRVSVVIPTYNEGGSIGRVLDDIPASLVTEVLVVDAGSTDGTREIAAARGARVIVEPRRGYGRACLTGVAAASEPDIVVFLDGDYSDRPRELGRLLDPIRDRQGRHRPRVRAWQAASRPGRCPGTPSSAIASQRR